ncbi:MAG: cyclic pyranopterin monophosphate synthase MoaC [Polyangiales bacterium]
MADELTHLDEHGRARMVDVSGKAITQRLAVARGRVVMQPSTLALVLSGQAPKGDVLAVARVAGIQAAKKTPELIPLCHTITLTGVEVDFTPNAAAGELDIEARVQALDRTGAEMEALTAVSVAALTIYDMLKAVDRAIRIERIALHEKLGGKSGHFLGQP